MSEYEGRSFEDLEAQSWINEESANRKKKKVRAWIITIVAVLIFVCALVVYMMFFVRYSGYTVTSTVDMTNSDENAKIFKYQDGYIKCVGEGLIYFNENGIIWSFEYNMVRPLSAVCGEYIAVVDTNSAEVYLFDSKGLLNTISLSRPAAHIAVSKYGVVAAATHDDTINYIEMKDREDGDLVQAKTTFSSSGYLSDIALSEDGNRLCAAYICVSGGSIKSKVVFYDFINGNPDENFITGQFEQYDQTIITNLKYFSPDRVAAIGDNAFTIYAMGSSPSIVYEDLDIGWQTQTLFFSDKYIGFVASQNNSDEAYIIKVFDTNGTLLVNKGFDYAYNHADFAGTNVLLYSEYDCDIYSFAGVEKFSHTFEERIVSMKSCGGGTEYIYMTGDATYFIKLK